MAARTGHVVSSSGAEFGGVICVKREAGGDLDGSRKKLATTPARYYSLDERWCGYVRRLTGVPGWGSAAEGEEVSSSASVSVWCSGWPSRL